MNANQILFFVTIAIFGIPVIISYIWGIKKVKDINLLWGTMPDKYQKILGISMLLCVISFFVFSSYILILNGRNLELLFIDVIYAILLGSASLWMPLTVKFVETKKNIYWILTRISLIIVGFCSFLLLVIVILTDHTGMHYIASIVGLTIFTFHTSILDGIMWPYFFKKD